VQISADESQRILQFMVNCGMPVKSAEVQQLTVGLLYLMRNGIMRGSEVILHKLIEIAQLMPAENMLYIRVKTYMPTVMTTVEHEADAHGCVTGSWTCEFFGEENIVHTMQHLLHGSTQSVDDLCRLCVVASQDHVELKR
jgi:hypothetical protein